MQFVRLRNAQWRINDSNKWKRLSHLQGTIKRNYSSYEYHGQLTDTQRLSTSVVSPHLEFLAGLNVSREVPALMMFAQAKMNKKLGTAKVVKTYSASSGSSSKKDCRRKVEQQTKKSSTKSASIVCAPRIAEADIKRLQPQYPILPESDCSCDRQPCPFDNIIDRTMDLEYLRQKLGVKHEGLTQDCSNFGQRINKKQALQQLIKAGSSNSCCNKDSSRSRVDKCGASGDDDDCNKPKKSCEIIKTVEKECEAREDRGQCVITKEERVLSKEEKRYIKAKEDPCEKKVYVCAQEETESCEVVQDPCEKEPVGKESWWQRLIDFFKARPGCPPPEEWKRKALREKAEKAAKAAGLIVCDPKDLPADIVCKCKSLPNVITPTVEKEDECDTFEEKDPCQSSAKMSGSHKRCGTTVTSITSKRCFSSKANSKALEEINKSLEEAEKRELAKKIVQSVNQMLTGSDVEEVGDENFESAEGAISDNVSTGNNKSNMFNSSQKMNQEPANLTCRTYLTRIRSTPHFLDVMFHDKADDEFSGYQRARAFVAFQEYFSKIDTVTEINYDDIEKAKTKKILSELDKLLEDTKKKSNKNG
ncbi:unnamed protein product [Acanthoscelides obtectus]|uniref:Uncharacterized protein n=1 Tax=Acanthoscelides obtectus TaxID=200917 RepID=A0A9P0LSQ2_ACAOB|nr:unnamed protein product [Acanthoscelides obtectus]CAK1683301.1 hypothetical protein AOBTE_LOCUS34191 [Acanthoscelides obtectus]